MLDRDDIISTASQLADTDQRSDESYVEGLTILISECRRSNMIPPGAEQKARVRMLTLLRNRINIRTYIKQHPELTDSPVEKPIVVFGTPRSGTTFLCQLLGADPARRSLMNWEAVDSVPPPTKETLATDSRCIAKVRAQEHALSRNPSIAVDHWEYANEPTECSVLHAQDFKSLLWPMLLPVPGYLRWLLNTSLSSAYLYEKTALQLLQSRAPGVWNLKMPGHALFMGDLLKVFPDARLIRCIRDPYRVLASTRSLMRNRHKSNLVIPDDRVIAEQCELLITSNIERSMKLDEVGTKLCDVHYERLVNNPMREVERIYEWIEEELTDQSRERIHRCCVEHPQFKFGIHSYSVNENELYAPHVQKVFASYVKRFKIPMEKH